MRPLVVVLVDEMVEASLLTFERGLRRTRRLSFQGPMHPFVCTVLLGMSGNDALDGDP